MLLAGPLARTTGERAMTTPSEREALAISGAAVGATVGAVVGSLFGVIGTALGAFAGATIGAAARLAKA
jgi:outer membrane lipoprotein SlyB